MEKGLKNNLEKYFLKNNPFVNAHTPKYMYVPPTSPASSFDLPSSSLGTSWSYLGVGLALILLLLSRSSIGIVNCSI